MCSGRGPVCCPSPGWHPLTESPHDSGPPPPPPWSSLRIEPTFPNAPRRAPHTRNQRGSLGRSLSGPKCRTPQAGHTSVPLVWGMGVTSHHLSLRVEGGLVTPGWAGAEGGEAAGGQHVWLLCPRVPRWHPLPRSLCVSLSLFVHAITYICTASAPY